MPPRKRAPSMNSGESDFEQFAKGRQPVQKHRKRTEEGSGDDRTGFDRSQFDNTQASEGELLSGDIASARQDVLEELRSYAEELQPSKAVKQARDTTDTLYKIQNSTKDTKEKIKLFRAGRALLIACSCAISSTEKYAGRLKEFQRPRLDDAMLQQWQQDIASLERVVDFGHQYGKHLSECAITGTKPYTPAYNEVDEDGMFALEIFESSTSMVAKDKTWGTCARKQVKGLKMLAPAADEDGRSHTPPFDQ